MRSNKLYNFINKKILGKSSYPSLKYRYFCKLLEKDFQNRDGATLIAVSPICKRSAARDLLLFLGYSLSNELNARVLLVDTVFENGSDSLSARLNSKSRDGFLQFISSDDRSLDDMIEKTAIKNVFFLPSGANEETVRLIMEPEKLAKACRELALFVDYVIFLQGDLRVDTRYISLSYLVDLNLLLVEENATLLSDIDECQKLYDDNNISDYKLLMTT